LAIRSSTEYKYISGPTQVIYSTSGEPNYSKEEYKLYGNNNTVIKQIKIQNEDRTESSYEVTVSVPNIPSVYLRNNNSYLQTGSVLRADLPKISFFGTRFFLL
jgi:hypothetical protein